MLTTLRRTMRSAQLAMRGSRRLELDSADLLDSAGHISISLAHPIVYSSPHTLFLLQCTEFERIKMVSPCLYEENKNETSLQKAKVRLLNLNQKQLFDCSLYRGTFWYRIDTKSAVYRSQMPRLERGGVICN